MYFVSLRLTLQLQPNTVRITKYCLCTALLIVVTRVAGAVRRAGIRRSVTPVYPLLADTRERGHGTLTLAAPTNDGY